MKSLLTILTIALITQMSLASTQPPETTVIDSTIDLKEYMQGIWFEDTLDNALFVIEGDEISYPIEHPGKSFPVAYFDNYLIVSFYGEDYKLFVRIINKTTLALKDPFDGSEGILYKR